MSNVDQLQKRYPSLPREIIVKWEILRNGIKDTEDLDKVSAWGRAGGTYQTYDFDVTLKQAAEKREGRVKPGFVKRPGSFITKNGLVGGLFRHTRSPYEIREIGDGRFALHEGEEMVEELYFRRPSSLLAEEPVTSKGTPITSLIAWKGGCFTIMPVRFCEYFTQGEECKFCNFNGTQDDVRAVGLDRPTTINLEETVEAYKIAAAAARIVEGRFENGAFRSDEQEMKSHTQFVEKIASAAPYKPNLTLHAQPMSRKDMQRLKDVGLDCPTFQMEVWDPVLFEEVCPGKAKHRGRERYLEALQELVDIFGVGSVGCVFVGGVTMVPEVGHKTWQEARDSMSEGMRWMIQHGVVPIITNLRLPPGSVYGADPANQERFAPTEYYLEVGMAHHQAMAETGLYEKMNKLMWCPMDCISVFYGGEIGMLERAGDVGAWLSDAMPESENWLARFVASAREKSATAG